MPKPENPLERILAVFIPEFLKAQALEKSHVKIFKTALNKKKSLTLKQIQYEGSQSQSPDHQAFLLKQTIFGEASKQGAIIPSIDTKGKLKTLISQTEPKGMGIARSKEGFWIFDGINGLAFQFQSSEKSLPYNVQVLINKYKERYPEARWTEIGLEKANQKDIPSKISEENVTRVPTEKRVEPEKTNTKIQDAEKNTPHSRFRK